MAIIFIFLVSCFLFLPDGTSHIHLPVFSQIDTARFHLLNLPTKLMDLFSKAAKDSKP
jgi:hypothetical protein